MIEIPVLFLENIELFFILLEEVDFVLEMGDDDFFLVSFDFERGVEVLTATGFGVAHLV